MWRYRSVGLLTTATDGLNTFPINERTRNKMPSLPSMFREIRRADVHGYIQLLLGLFIIMNWSLMDITRSITTEVAGTVVGLCAIAGGIWTFLNPDKIENGTDPTPHYLLFIGVIATIAFIALVVLAVRSYI